MAHRCDYPPHGISAADAHAAAQRMLNANPSLAHLCPLLSPASFVVDGYWPWFSHPHCSDVDYKIANALLKKGTRDAYKTWSQQDRAWVDMRLHESHDEGGFGVPNNTITRNAASYTTNARFVAFLGTFACPAQQVWLPGNDLQDSTT
jgi:hypothetical protein